MSQVTTSALVPSSHSFVEQLNVGVTGGSEQWVSDDGKHKISQTIYTSCTEGYLLPSIIHTSVSAGLN